jgi:hypothetical protein
MAMFGEDYGRHTALFDSIRRVGGYLFMRSDATDYVYKGMATYPQGSHLWAALLDNFVRSSTTRGSGLSTLDDYLWLTVAGYVLLALAVAWAAQWIAAGSLTLARHLVVTAAVFALLTTSDLFLLMLRGYPSEIAGLTEAVLLVAVLARPVPRVGQQLLTVGSLFVAIGFTYYLFLPAAAIAVMVALVRDRRRLLRHKIRAGVTVVVAGGLAVVPLAIGLLFAGQAEALSTTAGGRPSRDHLVALLCLVLAGALGARARRSRIWRGYLWCLAGALMLTGAMWVVQKMAGQTGSYYGNKTVHLVIAVLIVGLGAVTALLPPAARERGLPRLATLLPAVLLSVAVAGAFGLIRGDAPYRPVNNSTAVRLWYGRAKADVVSARDLLVYLRAATPVPAGTVTYVIGDDPAGYDTYRQTLFLSTLQGTSGQVSPGLYHGLDLKSDAALDAMITRTELAVRVIVKTDTAAKRAADLRARHPDRQIEIVRAG